MGKELMGFQVVIALVQKKNLILLGILIATLMSAIDTTIVILALPQMSVELQSPFLTTIWVILAYLLVLAAFTTQMGRLGDIFGRGRIFNFGFLVFIVGSAASGAAPTAGFLVGARVLQGLGAVLLQSNSGAIVADNFGPGERGRAFGITSMGWTIGGTLGIVLGGVITSLIGWRFIFFINVPIGLVGLYWSYRYIKDTKRAETRIDWGGTSVLVAVLGLIAYGATQIAGNGLTTLNGSMVLLGAALLVPFVQIELRVKDPVIDMRAFKEKMLSYSLLSAFLQAVGYLSVVFILIMYLQGIRGFTPLYSALLLVPGYVISSMLAPYFGSASDKFGPALLASMGIFLMAAGIMVYFLLTPTSTIYLVILGSVISGVGGSMFWPSNNSAVMTSAPRRLYGSVSGLLRTLSNMGTLLSYVISISIASLAVPRQVAFEVFLGVGKLDSRVSGQFLAGLHAAFLVSLAILVLAGIFSLARTQKKVAPEEISGTGQKD